MAVVFGGLTIANVAGVPMGALIGQQFGWRAAFAVIAVLAVVSLVAVAVLVPRVPASRPGPLCGELRVFGRPRLWVALAVTALSQTALFATFAYLAPLLTRGTGFPAGAVPVLLVVFGVGTVIGTTLGGRSADRNVAATLTGGLAALALVLAAFGLVGHHRVATVAALVAFGIAGFFINPALQTQAIRLAEGAPSLASVVNVAAFNLGNAAGPWLGGLALGAGADELTLRSSAP